MSRLYDVTITFDPKNFKENTEVEAVGISGEFLFYKSGLTGHTDETGMIDCEEKFLPGTIKLLLSCKPCIKLFLICRN